MGISAIITVAVKNGKLVNLLVTESVKEGIDHAYYCREIYGGEEDGVTEIDVLRVARGQTNMGILATVGVVVVKDGKVANLMALKSEKEGIDFAHDCLEAYRGEEGITEIAVFKINNDDGIIDIIYDLSDKI